MIVASEPRLALPADADVVTRTPGEAFAADPMVWWPLRSAPDVDASLAMFALWVNELIPLGTLWVVEDGLGVASWIGPQHAAGFVAADGVVGDRIREISNDDGVRYAAFWTWANAHLPHTPHWFLDMFAVLPGNQGRGLGSALMNHGLDRADQQRLPTLLETSQLKNVAFYETFGFKVVGQELAPGGGPKIWFVERPAQ